MEEEVDAGTIRPDWWMPASIAARTASNVTGCVAGGFLNLANLFVAYSNYGDSRVAFHEAAAQEIESFTEES